MRVTARRWRGLAAPMAAAIVLTTGCGQVGDTLDADVERVGSAIARGEAQISLSALSHRVMEDQGDFVLVDLRDPEDFDAFHIPGAVNLRAMEIVRPETAREVAGGRQLVLYGDSAVDAGQASALLQVAGFNAVALNGSFQDWFDYTSNPGQQVAGLGDQASPGDRQAFAEFFHGGAAAPSGYSPAVTPAAGGAAAALGLAPPPSQDQPAQAGTSGAAAALGLVAPVEEPQDEKKKKRRLIIGEGC